MKVLELFGGYGSQALALENLGYDFTSDLCEIDKYAIQAYNQLHGETHNWGDICKIDETQLPYYDLITYSSPCQDFSVAGKQAGGDKGSGTRSSLLWECERIIRAVKPKYLLMENVKALTSKKFMPLFANWLRTLESMGYQNYWKVLNAKDYGVPQNRERVFVVSILGGGQYQFPEPMPLKKRLKDVLEQNVDEKYYLSDEIVKRFVKSTEGQKQCLEPLACASRGRNPDNPSDRTTGSPTEQKDNYVVEPKIEFIGGIGEPNRSNDGKTFSRNYKQGYRVYDSKGLSTSLVSSGVGGIAGQTSLYSEPRALDEQNGYIRKDGCVGTLTTDGSSPKHNNRVVEPKVETHIIPQTVSVRKYDVDIKRLQEVLRLQKETLGFTNKQISEKLNKPLTNVEHWFRTDDFFSIPEKDVWFSLKELLKIETDYFDDSITEFEEKENVFEKANRCYGVNGVSPTLTSTSSDEKIVEPQIIQEPINLYPNSGNPQAGRVYNAQGISPAMDTCSGGNRMPKIIDDFYPSREPRVYENESQSLRSERFGLKVENNFRIRKLTPRECWRLMGVRDEQFDKLHDISNSQLYKMAGNSIVVDVLMAIFKNLFEQTEQKGQLGLL